MDRINKQAIEFWIESNVVDPKGKFYFYPAALSLLYPGLTLYKGTHKNKKGKANAYFWVENRFGDIFDLNKQKKEHTYQGEALSDELNVYHVANDPLFNTLSLPDQVKIFHIWDYYAKQNNYKIEHLHASCYRSAAKRNLAAAETVGPAAIQVKNTGNVEEDYIFTSLAENLYYSPPFLTNLAIRKNGKLYIFETLRSIKEGESLNCINQQMPGFRQKTTVGQSPLDDYSDFPPEDQEFIRCLTEVLNEIYMSFKKASSSYPFDYCGTMARIVMQIFPPGKADMVVGMGHNEPRPEDYLYKTWGELQKAVLREAIQDFMANHGRKPDEDERYDIREGLDFIEVEPGMVYEDDYAWWEEASIFFTGGFVTERGSEGNIIWAKRHSWNIIEAPSGNKYVVDMTASQFSEWDDLMEPPCPPINNPDSVVITPLDHPWVKFHLEGSSNIEAALSENMWNVRPTEEMLRDWQEIITGCYHRRNQTVGGITDDPDVIYGAYLPRDLVEWIFDIYDLEKQATPKNPLSQAALIASAGLPVPEKLLKKAHEEANYHLKNGKHPYFIKLFEFVTSELEHVLQHEIKFHNMGTTGGPPMQPLDIKFEHVHIDYHSGQHDYKLYAYLPDEVGTTLGWVDYSIYNDEVYINHIEVWPEYRGMGVGLALLQEMANAAPWEEIHKGYSTREGSSLVEKMNEWVSRNRTVGSMTPDEYRQLRERIETGEHRGISHTRDRLNPRDISNPNLKHLTKFDRSYYDAETREEREYDREWWGIQNARGTLISYCDSIQPKDPEDVVYYRYALFIELLGIIENIRFPNKKMWINFFEGELDEIEQMLLYYLHSDPNDPNVGTNPTGIDIALSNLVYSTTIDCLQMIHLLEYYYNYLKGVEPFNFHSDMGVAAPHYDRQLPNGRIESLAPPSREDSRSGASLSVYSPEFYDYVIAFFDVLKRGFAKAKKDLTEIEEQRF